jgi:hydrogenase maturation protein HypF
LAAEYGLSGTVCNDTRGVTIEAQGSEAVLDEFVTRLCDHEQTDYPALMDVWECGQELIDVVAGDTTFRIDVSDPAGQPISQVTPDCATCSACLKEMSDPKDFRYHYPFINCTHCGPRYSIVKTIPYDRLAVFMHSQLHVRRAGRKYGWPTIRAIQSKAIQIKRLHDVPKY